MFLAPIDFFKHSSSVNEYLCEFEAQIGTLVAEPIDAKTSENWLIAMSL
jgi:hypothetical protein